MNPKKTLINGFNLMTMELLQQGSAAWPTLEGCEDEVIQGSGVLLLIGAGG